VFIRHHLDVAGFSIFGTLASNGRRYTHMNEVPLINIGLRLIDVAAMDLQGERVTVSDRYARAATLRRHGATDREIEFLSRRRVELNAMTSRHFIEFIEAKFAEHGVEKVLPDAGLSNSGSPMTHSPRSASCSPTRRPTMSCPTISARRCALTSTRIHPWPGTTRWPK
jgi:hypothetical protein